MATQRETVRDFLKTPGASVGLRISTIASYLNLPQPSVRRILGELRRAHNIERIGRRVRLVA